jgi:hypothetical protein
MTRSDVGRISLLTLTIALATLAWADAAWGQAGPPLITDDPGTPGDGKWEINLALTLDQSRAQRSIEAPLLDLNYGVGERVQLNYEVAMLVLDEPGAGPVGGLSNSSVAVKWRFLDEDRHGVAMSIYPRVDFNYPAKSIRRGFVESGTGVLLPVEVAKTFGKWEVGAEVGYEFLQHADDQWIYGVAVGYPLSEKVELLGEIHGTVDEGFRRTEPLFNLGTRCELTEHMTFLFAAGRGFRDSRESPSLLVYAGLQWTF